MSESAFSVRVEFVARDWAEAERVREQIQHLLINEVRYMRVDPPARVLAPERAVVGGSAEEPKP